MSKKQVRLAEKTVQLARQELKIPANTAVSPDELMILLIMKSQDSREKAQEILDYAGDEFMQKVNGRNQPRLKSVQGHLVENETSLDIQRLLNEIDQKPSDIGFSALKETIQAMRQEQAKRDLRQRNFDTVNMFELKLALASLLKTNKNGLSASSVVADLALDETAKGIVEGLDRHGLETIKKQVRLNEKKAKSYYAD